MAAWLLPALFSAASIASNAVGASKQDSALASRMRAERQRQKVLDDKAFALNQQSLDRYKDADTSLEAETSGLADMFKSAASAPAPEAVMAQPATSSNIVTSATAKAAGETEAASGRRAEQMAGIRGLGDMLGGIGRLQSRDNAQLGMLRGFKQGSQGVLPLELQAAQGRGQGWRTLGDLFGLGAGLSTQSYLAGNNPGAGIAAAFGGGGK